MRFSELFCEGESMNRTWICLYISLTFATILGIFGQRIAHFIYYVLEFNPVYSLTIITIISVFLYLTIPLLGYILVKKQKVEKHSLLGFTVIVFSIGLPVSLWSLFVLVMWFG